MKPVAAFGSGERYVARSPWQSGLRYTAKSDALGRKLGALAKLLPKGPSLVVQTFRDTKSSRRGWGDVLLVPEKPVEYDAAAVAKRERLLPVIDPSLMPGGAK
jgi:hypothetical protein